MPWLIVILAYFIGAIPSAHITAGRKGKHIENVGDHNVGAANVFREISHLAGVAVFAFDALKGVLAVFIARAANLDEIWVLLSATAAIAGHQWSVFLRFKGGRGLSTMIGLFYVLLPNSMLIVTVPALLVLYFTKNVKIATAVAFVPMWAIARLMGADELLFIYAVALPCEVGLVDLLKNRLKTRQTRNA